MVSFIYFMQPLLIFIFGKILLKIENKIALSLMFSVSAAFLSAFLDALTVTAVLISVFVALYGVYEKVHSSVGVDYNENETFDRKEMGGDSLEAFRSFLRSLVMHGAVGTALGGVMTQVGEPQNLLIADKMGWNFIEFATQMAHITVPTLIAGLLVVIFVEVTGILGYGAKLEPHVRGILKGYIEKQDAERTVKRKVRINCSRHLCHFANHRAGSTRYGSWSYWFIITRRSHSLHWDYRRITHRTCI